MESAFKINIKAAETDFTRLVSQLESLNPLSVLARGYSVVSKYNAIVASSSQLSSGDKIEMIFADGKVNATVD